jgi:hypothetical protein
MTMTTRQSQEVDAERFARRGVYGLILGTGAFFAYFNSIHVWVGPFEGGVKRRWLEPLMPALEPYLPAIVILLGTASLAHAAYCLYRYAELTRTDRR